MVARCPAVTTPRPPCRPPPGRSLRPGRCLRRAPRTMRRPRRSPPPGPSRARCRPRSPCPRRPRARPGCRRARTRARSPRPTGTARRRSGRARPAAPAAGARTSAARAGCTGAGPDGRRRRARREHPADERPRPQPPSSSAAAPAWPASSAAAGTATSIAPNASPISTNTAASVRTPGARSAPPVSSCGPGRHARDDGEVPNTSVPATSSTAHATADAAATTTRAHPRSAPGRRCRRSRFPRHRARTPRGCAQASPAAPATASAGTPRAAARGARDHRAGSSPPARRRAAACEGHHRDRAHQRAREQDRRLPAAVEQPPEHGRADRVGERVPPDASPAAAKEPVSSFVRSTSTSDNAVAGARPTSDDTNNRAESPPRSRSSNGLDAAALARRGFGGVELALDDVQALVPEARVGEVDADDRAQLLRRPGPARRQQLQVGGGEPAPSSS